MSYASKLEKQKLFVHFYRCKNDSYRLIILKVVKQGVKKPSSDFTGNYVRTTGLVVYSYLTPM